MNPNNFMMGGGMPNQMQQTRPGNEQEQIFMRVYSLVQKSHVPQGTWHAMMDLRERTAYIMQLVTGLRMLNNDLGVCVDVAQRFEGQCFQTSGSKEQYLSGIRTKQAQVAQQRQQAAPQMLASGQNGLNPGMMQNGMMPSTPMQPNRSNQGNSANGFTPQFPNPMQPSPVNVSAAPNQMPNGTSQPTMPPNNQQPGQGVMSMNNFSPEEQKQIMGMASAMFGQVPKESQNAMRQQLFSKMAPQQAQAMARANQDPLHRHFMMQATRRLQQQKQQSAQQAVNGMMNMGGNNGMDNMQMQTGQRQQSQQQNQAGLNNQEVDFSALLGQQADAMKMQGAGELVVPMSNNPANNAANQPANIRPGNMSQNGQFPPGMTPQQMQQIMAARNQNSIRNTEAQAHAQAHAQVHNAQQLAQQQLQLRGQPGGLNANQPMQQTPQMSMLNRPMAPPGSTTPQSRPNQPTPAMAQMNGQNIMQQTIQQPSQMTPNQGQAAMQNKPNIAIPANMPPDMRQKLSTLSNEQVQHFLSTMQNQKNMNMRPPSNGLIPTTQGGQHPQSGLPNGLNQGMAVGQRNQQPGSTPMSIQEQQQQQIIANQNNAQRLKELESTRLPPNIAGTLGIPPLPPSVQLWGQLRAYLTQNKSTLPPDTLPKAGRMQKMIMQSIDQRRQANQANGQLMQAPPSSGPAANQPVPSTQAPTAQMTPQPTASHQQPNQPFNGPTMSQANGPPLPIPPPSAEDLNIIRMKLSQGGQGHDKTEEELKQFYVKWKMAQLSKANPDLYKQWTMRQQASREQQMAAQNGQQPRPVPGSQPGPRQGSQFGANNAVMAAAQAGQKRPAGDMPVTTQPQHNFNPNMAANAVAAAQGRALNAAQLSQLSPEQRHRYQMMMQQRAQMNAVAANGQLNPAQDGRQAAPQMQGQNGQQPQMARGPQPGSAPNADGAAAQNMARNKAQQLIAQIEANTKKGPPIAVDETKLRDIQERYRVIMPLVNKIEQSIPAGLQFFGEDTVRRILINRANFLHQFLPNGEIRDYVSLEVHELDQINIDFKKYLSTMMLKLQHSKQTMSQANTQPPQLPNGQQNQMPQPQQPAQPVPKAGENMVRAASQQNRKGSSSKPPSAPVTEQPPFPISAASPHGVPMYDNKTGSNFTPDKLHLPPNKKRKGGAAAGTPVTTAGTPGSVTSPRKTASPEMKRGQPPAPIKVEAPKEVEKRFTCKDESCQFFISGFAKEEELQKHVEAAHKPIEDALQFFLDSSLFAGEAEPEPAAAAAKSAQKTDAKTAAQQTSKNATLKPDPAKLKASATPMPTPAKADPSPRKRAEAKAAAAKAAEQKRVEEEKEKASTRSLQDTLSIRAGVEPSSAKAEKEEKDRKAKDNIVTDDGMMEGWDLFGGANGNGLNNAELLDGIDLLGGFPSGDIDMGEFDIGAMMNGAAGGTNSSNATPQLTPDEIGTSDHSDSSDGLVNLEIGEEDRLMIAFDLGEYVGKKPDATNGTTNGTMADNEANNDLVYGTGDGLDYGYPSFLTGEMSVPQNEDDWRKDEDGRDIFALMDFS